MSLKRIKIETIEEFKKKITEEFLPTLQHTTPCQVAGVNFPKDYICTIQLLTQQGMKVYSIWKDCNTGHLFGLKRVY